MANTLLMPFQTSTGPHLDPLQRCLARINDAEANFTASTHSFREERDEEIRAAEEEFMLVTRESLGLL